MFSASALVSKVPFQNGTTRRATPLIAIVPTAKCYPDNVKASTPGSVWKMQVYF